MIIVARTNVFAKKCKILGSVLVSRICVCSGLICEKAWRTNKSDRLIQ